MCLCVHVMTMNAKVVSILISMSLFIIRIHQLANLASLLLCRMVILQTG